MDTMNDALCATPAGPSEDVSFFSFLDNTMAPHYPSLDASTIDQVTLATDSGYDQAQAMRPRSFQFGVENNDHLFDFALTPAPHTQSCYPDNDGADQNGAYYGSASSQSISGCLPNDEHPILTASLDPFSCSSDWPFSWDDPTPSFSFSDLEIPCSGGETNTPSIGDGNDATDAKADMTVDVSLPEGQSTAATERETEVSLGDRAISGQDATSEATQARNWQQERAPTGWTYRQIFEILVFPPPEAPHLWHARISQLAADLGMPSVTTGREIVRFVMHVANVKNELDKVVPLAMAIAAAARILEGRNIVSSELQSMAVNLYPDAARAYGWRPAFQNSVQNGHYDEISLATSEERPLSVSPSGDGRKEEEATGGEEKDEPAPNRPRSRVAERDLYCRIGACLASFKDPRVCMKHRERHFPLAWRCPGPCRMRSANRGRFARDETLKRHLLFPRYESCKEVVLRTLGLESIPASGTSWLAPLRDSPERPWERHGFQLTDLETVKARLRDPNFVAFPPAAPAIGHRRYK